MAHGVAAGLRQGDAERRALLAKEAMRDLHEHAAAVAGLRVRADGAAMIEVEQDLKAHLDDGVRLRGSSCRRRSRHRRSRARCAGLYRPCGFRKAGIPHHGRAGGDIAQARRGLRRNAGALAALRCVCVPCTLAHCRLVRSPGSAFAAVIHAGFHPARFFSSPCKRQANCACWSTVSGAGQLGRGSVALRLAPAPRGRLRSIDRSVRPSGPRFASGTFKIALGKRPVQRPSCVHAGLGQCGRPRSWAMARQLGQHNCPNVIGHCQISEGHTSGQNRLSCKIVQASRQRRATNGKSVRPCGSPPDL